MKHYQYVGPDSVREKSQGMPQGMRVRSDDDVRNWLVHTGQQPNADGWFAVTFVVDEAGWLCISDRHSEHVACAGGGCVRSAGEMTFEGQGASVTVVEVSNQSTGYCPEPTSWPAVAAALARAGLQGPDGFTFVCTFRRCPACGQTNLVKDGWFFCEACDQALPKEWNFA